MASLHDVPDREIFTFMAQLQIFCSQNDVYILDFDNHLIDPETLFEKLTDSITSRKHWIVNSASIKSGGETVKYSALICPVCGTPKDISDGDPYTCTHCFTTLCFKKEESNV